MEEDALWHRGDTAPMLRPSDRPCSLQSREGSIRDAPRVRSQVYERRSARVVELRLRDRSDPPMRAFTALRSRTP